MNPFAPPKVDVQLDTGTSQPNFGCLFGVASAVASAVAGTAAVTWFSYASAPVHGPIIGPLQLTGTILLSLVFVGLPLGFIGVVVGFSIGTVVDWAIATVLVAVNALTQNQKAGNNAMHDESPS
ncbi:hypothetical protein FYK55_28515 [Roseiconus nitratireducens]|uniref:Uncharacterized protein n=1 Tax=Roseiconus nitratireducens TaxID=2605748 RepID=A0A5M6CJX1_9BACT|nr:hypothetical protein [Roseiconus nitratireducens]KAA5535424.1 hypothetical protein FYK55_28515 [Roseiconus nitratireducens]